jgi:hypothetical protein
MYTMEQMQTMAEVAAKAAVAHMTQAFQAQAEAKRPTPAPPVASPCDEDLVNEIDEMPVATFADEACAPIAVRRANVVALNRIASRHLGADNPKAARSLPLPG